MSTTRVISGAALVPVLFAFVWYLPQEWFLALAVAASTVGQHELYVMARTRGYRPLEVTGIVIGVFLIVSIFTFTWLQRYGAGFPVVAAIMTVLVVRLFSRRPVEGAFEDIATTLLGVLYVALLFGFQVGLHRGMQGRHFLTFLYLVIWASDTGAYYAGTAFGKHRLYEKISPKKSIEGLAGGMALSMAVGWLCSQAYRIDVRLALKLTPVEAVVLGAVLALAGTVGDLVESLIKRSAGVKDSGTLIPGHGGILDRMDSMLFAAPLLYYYLRMR